MTDLIDRLRGGLTSLLSTEASHTGEELLVALDVEDALTDRRAEGVDIGSELLLHIAVADSTVVVETVEVLVDLRRRDDLHQREEVLDRLGLLAVRLGRTSVRDGTHDLLRDRLLVVDEVDRIAFALAHLP